VTRLTKGVRCSAQGNCEGKKEGVKTRLNVVLAGSVFVAVLTLGLMAATPIAVQAAQSPVPAAKVDINSASQADLEKLPGVGEATAKKIIAGRPYQAVGDLSKAGVSKTTVEKITPLVTAGPAGPAKAATPASAAPAVPGGTSKAAASEQPKPAPSVAKAAPGKGMVWVNTDSKVFHREGDRWYGKTKQGKYMTEADALKDGYRPAKEGAAKKSKP